MVNRLIAIKILLDLLNYLSYLSVLLTACNFVSFLYFENVFCIQKLVRRNLLSWYIFCTWIKLVAFAANLPYNQTWPLQPVFFAFNYWKSYIVELRSAKDSTRVKPLRLCSKTFVICRIAQLCHFIWQPCYFT